MKGVTLFFYLHAICIELYAKLPSIYWNNFTLLKNYLFQNLFNVLTNFKQYFLIAHEDSLEDLETELAMKIQDFRNSEGIQHADQGMVDKLDLHFYETFLDLKADYNSLAPFNKDIVIYNDIVNDILKKLKSFYTQYENSLNINLRSLITTLALHAK